MQSCQIYRKHFYRVVKYLLLPFLSQNITNEDSSTRTNDDRKDNCPECRSWDSRHEVAASIYEKNWCFLITITKAQLDWKQVLKLPLKTSTQTFELVSRRQILDEQLIVTAIVYKLLGKPYSNDSLFTQVLQLCSRTIQNYLYERANSEENLVNRAQIMNLQVWKLYLVIKTLLSTIKRPKFIFSKATKALCVLLFEISKAFLR